MNRKTIDYITTAALAATIAVATVLSVFFFTPAYAADPLFRQWVLLVYPDGTTAESEVQSLTKLPKLYLCFDRVQEKRVLTCLTTDKQGTVHWLDIPVVNPNEGVAI